MTESGSREYRTALPALLARAVGEAANRLVALDGEWQQKATDLNGHSARVVLSGTGLSLTLKVTDARFEVSEDTSGSADVVVQGTPLALFGMVGPKGRAGKSPGRVEVRGDAAVGQRFAEVLKNLEPDWDEPIARLFGDVAGHQIASLLREGMSWSQQAASSLSQTMAEYLVEESRLVVGKQELDEFADQVDDLAEATERLLARSKRKHPSA